MSENLHDIDKLFRDGIEGQEEMPSPGIWNELDKKLDKRKVASIAGKYKKLKWVAAALFLFSIGMGMYVYHVHKDAELVKNGKHPGSSTRSEHSEPVEIDKSGRNNAITSGKTDNTVAERSTLRPGKTDRLQNSRVTLNEPSQPDNQLSRRSVPSLPVNNKAKQDLAKNDAGQPAVQNYVPPVNDEKPINKSTRDISLNKAAGEKLFIAKKQHRYSRGEHMTNDQAVTAEKLPAAGYPKSIVQREPYETVQEHSSIQQPVRPDLHGAFVNSRLPDTRLLTSIAVPVPPFIHALPFAPGSAESSDLVKLTPVRKSRFTATLLFSPNLVSNKVTSNDVPNRGPRQRGDDPKEIKNKEQNGSSWSAGALLGYNVNARWSIESGLILSTRSIVSQPKTIYARADDHGNVRYLFNCSSGFSFIDLKQGSNPLTNASADSVSSTNKLQYLSVPIALKYSFGDGRLHFNTGFGLQTNFLVSRKIDTYITKANNKEHTNTSDIQGLRPMYVSSLLSAGISYRLNNILIVSATPNAQIGFMSINRMAPVKSYVNFYGIAAGISIKL